ncbi:hypothetical protein WME79_10085 [Sorangium sp. So ce726]|uniref:hypothetical protein n=1 Tax=Sorangium sp. So ce726 TaxID=3133319 RepID=UPI003F61E8A6
MNSAQERSDSARSARTIRACTADGLQQLDSDALLELYRGATTPRLTDVRGDLSGKVVMICGLQPPFARWISDFVRETTWWAGKTFRVRDDRSGEGYNRLRNDTRQRFPFDTSIGRSRVGDFDALHLDYDCPENPSFVRNVADELRELSPGLYLGQVYVRIRGKLRLTCYFSLAK